MDHKIRSKSLLGVMQSWRAAIQTDGGLPSFLSYHAIVRDREPSSFLACVEPDGFRFINVGERLTGRLGRPLEGELVENDAVELFGSLKSTYQRCVQQRAPCYEFLRCRLGDGVDEMFERLTLPFAGNRSSVTHIGGTVSFENFDTGF